MIGMAEVLEATGTSGPTDASMLSKTWALMAGSSLTVSRTTSHEPKLGMGGWRSIDVLMQCFRHWMGESYLSAVMLSTIVQRSRQPSVVASGRYSRTIWAADVTEHHATRHTHTHGVGAQWRQCSQAPSDPTTVSDQPHTHLGNVGLDGVKETVAQLRRVLVGCQGLACR